MTRRSIDEQVEILKSTTERASVSSQAASEFLTSAGIVTINDRVIRAKNDTYPAKGERANYAKSSAKFVVRKIK